MRICHFSDLHASLERHLPEADVYVCTGDMLPNFPMTDKQGCFLRIERFREMKLQSEWLDRFVPGRMRGFMRNRDAPVICVRGNHDFIDLRPLFGGEVFEVNDDPSRTVEIEGIRFGGMRGIKFIRGNWNDELDSAMADAKVAQVPRDIDVLVSHSPPERILDGETFRGMSALRSYVSGRMFRTEQDGARPLRAHLFGHDHVSNGIVEHDGVIFSNAATTVNIIDI